MNGVNVLGTIQAPSIKHQTSSAKAPKRQSDSVHMMRRWFHNIFDHAACSAQHRGMWIAACVMVMLAGITARVCVHTRNPITPSMDGGYYAIQPRSLLRTGALDYPDVPLKFALDACVAKVLMATTAMDINSACMRASQVTDCIAAPLMAVPIFLLAFAWRDTGARGGAGIMRMAGAAIAVATAATLAFPALRMTADFQKNTLAMLLYLVVLQQVQRAAACRPTRPKASLVHGTIALLLLGMTALTHVGTGAAAALTIACIGACAFVWQPRMRILLLSWRGVLCLVLTCVAATIAFMILQRWDAVRAAKLLAAPALLFSDGDAGEGFMPRFQPTALASFVCAVLIAAGAWRCCLGKASTVAKSDRWFVMGCAVAACALTFPMMHPEYLQRIALLAMVPGAVALLCVLVHQNGGWRGQWPASLLMIVALASCVPGVMYASRPAIDANSLDELRAMADLVPQHRRVLLVARHGLEFWANYAMDVNTRQSSIPADAFARYDRVLVLMETKPFGPAGRREGGPNGEREGVNRGDRGDRGDRGGPPPGMPRGARGVRPPDGSQIIFEGKYYKLFEVPRDANRVQDEPPSPISTPHLNAPSQRPISTPHLNAVNNNVNACKVVT